MKIPKKNFATPVKSETNHGFGSLEVEDSEMNISVKIEKKKKEKAKGKEKDKKKRKAPDTERSGESKSPKRHKSS